MKEQCFSDKRLLCIKPHDGSYCVVGFSSTGFVCYTCASGRYVCSHVSCLKAVLEKENESLPDFVCEMDSLRFDLQKTGQKPQNYLPRVISYSKIRWNTTVSQQKIYRMTSEISLNNLTSFAPACNSCLRCDGEMSEPVYPVQKILYVLHNYVQVEGTIFSLIL